MIAEPFIATGRRLWRAAERSRAIGPMLLSICLIGIGSAMLTIALSFQLSVPGADAQAVKFILSAYPIGFLAGCLVARPLITRFGHQRSFLLIAGLAAASTAGFLVTASMPVWFSLRFVGGLAMAALFVIAESWVNLYAAQHNRGRYFSIYMLTTALAALFGQLLVEVIGPHSPYLFHIAAAVILLAVIYEMVRGDWPALPPAVERPGDTAGGGRFGLWRLIRTVPVTVVSIFQAGMTNLNVFVMTPIYSAQIGIDAVTAAALVTMLSIGGTFAQAPVGWLSDRFDRRVILLLQGLLALSLCLAIAWMGSRTGPLLTILFIVYGAIVLTIYPVAIAFANSQLHSRHMVSASGSLLLLYSVGNVMTPGIAATLMERTVPQALFLMLGSGGALVAIAALINMLWRPARDAQEAGS